MVVHRRETTEIRRHSVCLVPRSSQDSSHGTTITRNPNDCRLHYLGTFCDCSQYRSLFCRVEFLNKDVRPEKDLAVMLNYGLAVNLAMGDRSCTGSATGIFQIPC